MCRDKNHPNARRCPSSHGELRNARDRANYRARSAASKSSPVDPSKTAAPEPVIPISLEDAVASVRDDIHSYYHFRNGVNPGYSQYDPDTGEGRIWPTGHSWRDFEQNVINVGAALEDRASVLAGFTAEEAVERSNARIQMVKDRIEPLNEKLDATRKTLQLALQDINRLDMEDPNGDHSELEARIDELKMLRDEQQMEAVSEAQAVARECGFGEVKPGDVNDALRKIQQGVDPMSLADSKMLAEARIAALSEVRDMGGVEVETNDNSSKRVAALMSEVAGFYPADWLRKSNEVGNLKVKDTKGRAHYSERRTQKVRKEMTENSWTSGDEEPKGDGWVRGVWTGSGWSNPLDNPDAHEKYAEYAGQEPPDERVMWVRPAMKTRRARDYWNGTSVEGKPPRGWTEGFEELADGTRIRVFQQPMYRMTRGEVVAELTVDKSVPLGQWQETKGFDTAIHEFAHRAEHVNPVIFHLEEAFLRRRTTDAEGERDKLEALYWRGREVGRPDSFANKYMGKEYPDNYREVMSTGMQALFAGQFGGLAGGDGQTADADMRAFVMGVLATA